MPVELLRQLADETLPQTVDDVAELDKLRVLRAAKLVAVLFLRSPTSNSAPANEQASVLANTPAGRRALQ